MVGCLGALRLATQLRPASQSLAQVLEVLLSELGRSYTTNQLSWTPIWDAGKKHHNRLGNHLADHTVDVFVGFMRKTYEQIMCTIFCQRTVGTSWYRGAIQIG